MNEFEFTRIKQSLIIPVVKPRPNIIKARGIKIKNPPEITCNRQSRG